MRVASKATRIVISGRLMASRIVPTATHELAFSAHGYQVIAGVDEAGRGALAGPLVASAVVLRPDAMTALDGFVCDSKLLTPARRRHALTVVCAAARAVGVGFAEAAEIDRIGVAAANRVAMERAVDALHLAPDLLLLDACVVEHGAPQIGLIDGDALCVSIAAASIVAKVTRDRVMHEADGRYPAYGFARHVGYGTAAHLTAIARHGPCDLHRFSFAPVAQYVDRMSR